MNYYNEFNPESAAMLRQLMADGLIPKGIVDERSIELVAPDELREYTQCHFFAGIGGWSMALQLAGWTEDRPVWTGSCPCQPFSSAGRQKGKEDARHLWPVWQRLIIECRPPTIFGEQVASAVAHGWLDDVYQGLEPQGYSIGAAVLPACSVGAPHRRERLFFVAHAEDERGKETRDSLETQGFFRTSYGARLIDASNGGCSLADPKRNEDNQKQQRPESDEDKGCSNNSSRCDVDWQFSRWVACPDGKQRLVEPRIPLLVDGFQHRRPILHAIGNAIVPQVAAKFIEAYMES